MKQKLFLLFLCYCSVYYNAFAQLDEREAFKMFKKQTGTWQTKGEETIFEDWQKISKYTIDIKQYQLQGADTVVLFTAKLHYFRSRTIWKQDEISYTIKYTDNTAKPNTTHRFRLYESTDNAFIFYTYLEGIRHQLAYQAVDKGQMLRKHTIEKEENGDVLIFFSTKKR